jgi:2-methylisocitrate lyase-like PEP mutase family enzyme
MRTQEEKCINFKKLHDNSEAFVIANPWDTGSARLLQGMGFKALATSSSGFALALGKQDGQPTLEEKLSHCRAVAAATDIPVSADFEDGYASSPEDVAKNVANMIETGVAGCSIEDFDRAEKQLFEASLAIERVSAAVEVVKALDFPFQLTARAEHLLRGRSSLDEVIERLNAYEAAGADVLFAPGIGSLEDLKTVTDAIEKPFNVLGVMVAGASLADFQAAGAQRVSIGGSLPFVGMKPIIESCEAMLNEGSFDWVQNMAPPGEVISLMNRGAS